MSCGLKSRSSGRVSGNRQLGEGYEVGVDCAGAVDVVEYPGGVAVEVADRGVGLGQRQAEGAHRGVEPTSQIAASIAQGPDSPGLGRRWRER